MQKFWGKGKGRGSSKAKGSEVEVSWLSASGGKQVGWLAGTLGVAWGWQVKSGQSLGMVEAKDWSHWRVLSRGCGT